jgi:hypothetical protein
MNGKVVTTGNLHKVARHTADVSPNVVARLLINSFPFERCRHFAPLSYCKIETYGYPAYP